MPPEPVILAFDTSAAHCAAALLSGGRIVASLHEPMEKGQAERLFPLLEEVLRAGGAGWRDLTALAVGTGPGNFTGVRIAVAAARGLALSLALPAHGVTRFEALAHGFSGPVLAVVDARQGRAYLQRMDDASEPELAELSALPGRYGAGCSANLTVVGDHARQVAQMLGAAPAAEPRRPLAEAMALVAATRPPPSHRPAPLYLRPADAAPSRDAPPVILP